MCVCLASTYCIILGLARKTEATQFFKCERLYCRKLKVDKTVGRAEGVTISVSS